jgi:hypothetical protein
MRARTVHNRVGLREPSSGDDAVSAVESAMQGGVQRAEMFVRPTQTPIGRFVAVEMFDDRYMLPFHYFPTSTVQVHPAACV